MVPLKRTTRSARFTGLRPASARASYIASASSKKRGTKCEVKLSEALHKLGLKFRQNVGSLPGCPDFVFDRERILVFVDGDFWHGRNLKRRLAALSTGHNGEYWVRKIRSNVVRDRRVRRELRMVGWHVIRIWESQINSDMSRTVRRIANAVGSRS